MNKILIGLLVAGLIVVFYAAYSQLNSSNSPIITGAVVSNIPDSDVEFFYDVLFEKNSKTIISIRDDGVKECGDINEASELLKSFIEQNKGIAEIPEDYLDCMYVKDTPMSMIILELSDYPFIWQPMPNCYIIRVGQCEALNAASKFIESVNKIKK